MPFPGTELVRKGIADFGRLLEKAKEDNYFTLCWYLWESLNQFSVRLHEMRHLASVLFELHTKNLINLLANEDGLGLFKFDPEAIKEEDYIIQLVGLNHIIECHELYDILISLSMIARSEIFLVRDDGFSVNYGVGCTLKFDEGERDRLAARLKFLRQEILAGKHHKLANLLKRCFNTELRNAFSHSEYEIRGHEIYLTKYKRTITEEALADAFIGSYYILESLTQFIEGERQRFAASGGIEEGGWTLKPNIFEGKMSVTLSSSSPVCTPTGRVRRARLGLPID
jgi:hypothetical protein